MAPLPKQNRHPQDYTALAGDPSGAENWRTLDVINNMAA